MYHKKPDFTRLSGQIVILDPNVNILEVDTEVYSNASGSAW